MGDDVAFGFAAPAQGCHHCAGVVLVVEQVEIYKFVDEGINEGDALFIVLVWVIVAGFPDFAEHDAAEVLCAA